MDRHRVKRFCLGQFGHVEYPAERKRFYEQPWKVLAALAVDELKNG